MNAFKKILVTVAAAATLGGAVLSSTQASAWCGDYSYGAYSYSPSYDYNSYGYDSYGYDHNGHREFRGHYRRH